jgi:hypothetical protein
MPAPPRYQPERVLPRYAYRPGRNPHPTRGVSGHARESVVPARPSHLPAERWRDNADYLWGVDLYNTGYFWEAHEAWEGLWRAAERDRAQRRFLQGLIQCAAACLKAAIGDDESCLRLAARALTRLRQVPADDAGLYMGLALPAFMTAFERSAQTDPPALAHPPPLRLVGS